MNTSNPTSRTTLVTGTSYFVPYSGDATIHDIHGSWKVLVKKTAICALVLVLSGQ